MIEIGGYKIYKSDSLNWSVEQNYIGTKGKNKGERIWKNRGYFPTLESASLSLFDILVSKTDVTEVSSLIEVINAAKAAIIEAISKDQT